MLKKLIGLTIAVLLLFSLAACNPPEEDETMGTFYSLQEAYKSGLLSQKDLFLIAAYQGSLDLVIADMPIYSRPVPQTPLTEQIANSIKQTRVNWLNAQGYITDAALDDVSIDGYYGTYNGSVAVMISDAYHDYTQALWELTVGGVTFYFNSIVIWKPNPAREISFTAHYLRINNFSYSNIGEIPRSALISNAEQLRKYFKLLNLNR